jgi:hypothetical protein
MLILAHFITALVELLHFLEPLSEIGHHKREASHGHRRKNSRLSHVQRKAR